MLVPGFPDFAIASLIFFAAGAVKGVLGMGLPTVAMGLLGLVMPVAQAASLLAVPSLATNVWQAAQGAHLRALMLRLWPLQLGVVLGVAAGSGFMQAGSGRGASLLLGGCLVVYGITGLAGWVLRRPPRAHERWGSVVVGVLTGLLTAATGVFVLPAVPWLQALGLDKDEMSQALGIGFTVSTLALAASLSAGGSFTAEAALHSALLLLPAMAGMALGQRLRGELSQQAFRRVFFAGLLALGSWLLLRQL